MIRAIRFIVSCVLIVLLVDILLGLLAKTYLKNSSLPGDYESIDYILKRCDEDVIILGSSVALNSLMPTTIEATLGTSCFNGGANAQNMTFFETEVECILKRYVPKMIILGLRHGELEGNGIGSRYNILVPYYGMGYNHIDSCLESRTAIEPYLLKSSLYRYNTIWWRIFLYHFMTPDEKGEKGFVSKGIPAHFPTLIDEVASNNISEERISQIENIIQMCEEKGVRIVVYMPPVYVNIIGESASTRKIGEICEQHNIVLFDDSQNSVFHEHPEWFYDNYHLNGDGAIYYSTFFAERLYHQLNSVHN